MNERTRVEFEYNIDKSDSFSFPVGNSLSSWLLVAPVMCAQKRGRGSGVDEPVQRPAARKHRCGASAATRKTPRGATHFNTASHGKTSQLKWMSAWLNTDSRRRKSS